MEPEQKLLSEGMLERSIEAFRGLAFKGMSHPEAPNVFPHVLLFLSSMAFGVTQAAATIISSKTAELAEESKSSDNPGAINPDEVLVTLTDDVMTFTALLMLRSHRLQPGIDGGVLTEMSPDIISGAIEDFKKLKGRPPSDINPVIFEIETHKLNLKEPTHNLGSRKH